MNNPFYYILLLIFSIFIAFLINWILRELSFSFARKEQQFEKAIDELRVFYSNLENLIANPDVSNDLKRVLCAFHYITDNEEIASKALQKLQSHILTSSHQRNDAEDLPFAVALKELQQIDAMAADQFWCAITKALSISKIRWKFFSSTTFRFGRMSLSEVGVLAISNEFYLSLADAMGPRNLDPSLKNGCELKYA